MNMMETKMGDVVNVVRMTISIPKEVKSQMDDISGVNWSSVAAQAFEDKVISTNTAKPAATDEELVEWMRQADAADLKRDYDEGHNTAVQRIRSKALRPRDLRHFAEEYENAPSVDDVGDGPRRNFVLRLLYDIEGLDDEELDHVSEEVFGDTGRRMRNCQFARGFVEGLLETWIKLEKKL